MKKVDWWYEGRNSGWSRRPGSQVVGQVGSSGSRRKKKCSFQCLWEVGILVMNLQWGSGTYYKSPVLEFTGIIKVEDGGGNKELEGLE